jgi:hydroxypyruvate isomerase
VNSGLDIYEQIDKHADLLGHVHIADYPGRHEPGSGTLDFDQIRSALTRAGYNGWLGCEYIPAGRTDDGLSWYHELRKTADSVAKIG